jgi:hypothetical protein
MPDKEELPGETADEGGHRRSRSVSPTVSPNVSPKPSKMANIVESEKEEEGSILKLAILAGIVE